MSKKQTEDNFCYMGEVMKKEDLALQALQLLAPELGIQSVHYVEAVSYYQHNLYEIETSYGSGAVQLIFAEGDVKKDGIWEELSLLQAVCPELTHLIIVNRNQNSVMIFVYDVKTKQTTCRNQDGNVLIVKSAR